MAIISFSNHLMNFNIYLQRIFLLLQVNHHQNLSKLLFFELIILAHNLVFVVLNIIMFTSIIICYFIYHILVSNFILISLLKINCLLINQQIQCIYRQFLFFIIYHWYHHLNNSTVERMYKTDIDCCSINHKYF